MGDGRRRRRRRQRKQNPQSKSAAEDKADAIPDELLCLVFLCLTSPVDLVRAASACRRWRRAIASDVFRVVCSQHGAPPSHVVGHYSVDEPLLTTRPPGRYPHFVPSSSTPWKEVVAPGFLELDFLPPTEYGESKWELADVRGGLLLLARFSATHDLASPLGLVVCDPLARRYKTVPASAWFRGRCYFLGSFLLDGEDDAAGARISLSNFRATCVIYRDGIAKAYAFSSAGGGRWTSSAHGSTVVFRNDYWTAPALAIFAGSTAGCAYWTIVNRDVALALDKEAGELSSCVLPEALRGKPPSQDYAYELPWPPTIRACL